MSRENVELTQRAADAYNRRDVEVMLEWLDPEVEWYSALSTLLSGKATVYRGHRGIREWFREIDEALDEIHVEYTDIRDLGDRVIAIGRIRTRGTYLDPKEALEAAGLTE